MKRKVTFPESLGVTYHKGIDSTGLSVDTGGNSWFYAKKLEANSDYKLHKGTVQIVAANKVIFIGNNAQYHEIERDDPGLYWFSTLIDSANVPCVRPA